jgi:hypothetical protein
MAPNESERLAIQFQRALTGEAWHGPSWQELLDGVDREAATRRPLEDAHTIAEIALHTVTWQDAVRRRLEGETPDVPESENWPRGDLHDDAAWEAVKARLLETGEALRETIRRFPAGRLPESRPGMDGTWYELIAGELQHVLYHAGQVALLRKQVPARR